MSQIDVRPSRTQSEQMWERAKVSLGGGVSTGIRAHMPPHPIFIDHGAGSRIWDVDGNEYIDYVLAWGPLILGHCPPGPVEAVTRQLKVGTTFGSGHRWEIEAAEAILSAMPGVERVLWSNTGTEAVQSALRLARAATGRQVIVKFEGHYHGWMDSVLLSYRHLGTDHSPMLESLGQNPDAVNDIVTIRWNDESAFTNYMSHHGTEVAAVIAEPVLCNSGVIEAHPGFLQLLRDVTHRDGAVLIFDEVITGFRIALGGASERYGVEPDLHTLGKALGAGYPASAIAGRAELIDQVTAGVVHAGTYNGSAMVLAGVHATLVELSAPGVFENLELQGRALADGFRDVLARVGVPFVVNQVGPVVQCALGVSRLDSYDDFALADWAAYNRLVVALLDRGVFALPGGRWYLSTAHAADDVASTVAAFGEAVKAEL